jgi:hypothetical protein
MAIIESLGLRKIFPPSLFDKSEQKVPVRVELETQQPMVSGELSPEQILAGNSTRDQAVSVVIRESLNPRWNMGPKEVVKLADLDGGLFVCKPIPGAHEGGSRAPFWLDPDTWQTSLNEFTQFAQSHASGPLHFLVEAHVTDGLREHILVKPIMIDPSGVYENGHKYGLQIDGRISLGRDEEGTSEMYDLGYLNPGRVILEKNALLRAVLQFGR